MQSFKVLLQHREACRPGGVLVGFFWTDPGEIDRSFPLPGHARDRGHRRPGRLGHPPAVWRWPSGRCRRPAHPAPSCSAGPASWWSTAPCSSSPPRSTNGSAPASARSASSATRRPSGKPRSDRPSADPDRPPRIRIFPHGGLTYAGRRSPRSRIGRDGSPIIPLHALCRARNKALDAKTPLMQGPSTPAQGIRRRSARVRYDIALQSIQGRLRLATRSMRSWRGLAFATQCRGANGSTGKARSITSIWKSRRGRSRVEGPLVGLHVLDRGGVTEGNPRKIIRA